MSRSRKHSPGGTLAHCKSQKGGKQWTNRVFRRLVRKLLLIHGENTVLPLKRRELVNTYDMEGDGKIYREGRGEKWMRK